MNKKNLPRNEHDVDTPVNPSQQSQYYTMPKTSRLYDDYHWNYFQEGVMSGPIIHIASWPTRKL